MSPPTTPPLRSRGSTKRSADSPMGDSSAASVRAGNLMVGRLMVLMLLAYAKRCWWSLEQPCNSLLEGHVLFQELLRFRELAVVRVSTSLGWFGSDSKKPLWIYSSPPAHLIRILLFSGNARACALIPRKVKRTQNRLIFCATVGSRNLVSPKPFLELLLRLTMNEFIFCFLMR